LGKYYMMPLTVRAEGETVETTIELYPSKGVASVSLLTESDSYDEDEEVSMIIEISPAGPETVVIIPSGRKVEFKDGERVQDVSETAHKNLAAWSESGGFAGAEITVEKQLLIASIDSPSKVAEGKQFEMVISVDGERGKSVRFDFEGESTNALLPAEFVVERSLTEDATLMFTLTSGKNTKMLSKRITVVPRPKITRKLIVDSKIVQGVLTYIGASGNGQVKLETPYGSKEGSRSTVLEVTPDVCGTNTVKITVTVEDELGNEFNEIFEEEFEVVCGVEAWVARLLLLIEGLLK